MIERVLIECGREGSDRTAISVRGMSFENPVGVFMDADPHRQTGEMVLVKEVGVLYGFMDVRPEHIGLYPAVIVRHTTSVKNGKHTTVHESVVMGVSLSKQKNEDPHIKPVKS